jgi:hypothetical protein
MDIVYRPAEKADSQRVAELISLASDGVVDFLFHDLVPDMTPNQVVAHNLAQDRYPHSYRMCSLIAFRDNAPALALYEAVGFRPLARIHLAGNAFIPHADGCALLTCQVSM